MVAHRLALFVYLFTLVVSVGAGAQSYPDAPHTKAKRESMWTPEVHPEHVLSWSQTFSDKRFWVPHAVLAASIAWDVEWTMAKQSQTCVEANDTLPQRPSRSELYRNALLPAIAITLLDGVMRKGNMPFFIYDGPAGYGTFVHIRGGARWMTRCR